MKELYRFEVKDGAKPRKFVVVRPNKRQVEEAQTQYSIEFSQSIRKGILTKDMLANKYEETGGTMSKSTAKHLSGLYHDLNELTNEAVRLKKVKAQNKKNKDRLLELEEELVTLRKKIVEIETNNISLFQDTAEMRAQTRVIVWYGLHLLLEEVEEELVPYYDGIDYEDKLDQYYEREDAEDNDFHLQVMGTASVVVGLWYYNQGMPNDKFEKLVKEHLRQDQSEKKEEETSDE